jgi:sporulation-control protein spo0M
VLRYGEGGLGCAVYVRIGTVAGIVGKAFFRTSIVGVEKSHESSKLENVAEGALNEEFCISCVRESDTPSSLLLELLKPGMMGKAKVLDSVQVPVEAAAGPLQGQLFTFKGGERVELFVRAVRMGIPLKEKLSGPISFWKAPRVRICLPRQTYFAGECVNGYVVVNSGNNWPEIASLKLKIVCEWKVKTLEQSDKTFDRSSGIEIASSHWHRCTHVKEEVELVATKWNHNVWTFSLWLPLSAVPSCQTDTIGCKWKIYVNLHPVKGSLEKTDVRINVTRYSLLPSTLSHDNSEKREKDQVFMKLTPVLEHGPLATNNYRLHLHIKNEGKTPLNKLKFQLAVFSNTASLNSVGPNKNKQILFEKRGPKLLPGYEFNTDVHFKLPPQQISSLSFSGSELFAKAVAGECLAVFQVSFNIDFCTDY